MPPTIGSKPAAGSSSTRDTAHAAVSRQPPGAEPVQAALQILDGELAAITSWLAAQDDLAQASAAIRRFGTMIHASPSLRAHQSDMTGQFVAVAAEILAGQAGLNPDDPEPQIAATALLGLWRIQFRALSKHLDGTRTPRRSTKPSAPKSTAPPSSSTPAFGRSHPPPVKRPAAATHQPPARTGNRTTPPGHQVTHARLATRAARIAWPRLRHQGTREHITKQPSQLPQSGNPGETEDTPAIATTPASAQTQPTPSVTTP